MLETWNREEQLEVQENRQMLEKASGMISQRAHGFIGQAIERTLRQWRLGAIESEDGDLGLGRAPRGASAGEKGVSVLEYPTLARCTKHVAFRVSRF